MDEEEKKIRYEKIVRRLRTICNEIETLETHLDSLKISNENALKINGSGVGTNSITNSKSYIDSASNVIKNTIIPNLNDKINR